MRAIGANEGKKASTPARLMQTQGADLCHENSSDVNVSFQILLERRREVLDGQMTRRHLNSGDLKTLQNTQSFTQNTP